MGDQENAATGCLSNMDRLSDLPDSILHHIISFLGTKQACRTSILSKRWLNIWPTSFILDFDPNLFENVPDKFVSFVETTMQRYSDRNLSIRKLTLEYWNYDEKMETGKIDRWLGIAVENQVEDLELYISDSLTLDDLPTYGLPMVLFSAKSLISLECSKVRVPRFPSVMLISLQSLNLMEVDVDEHMLHHLISSCPLKELRLNECTGITNLVIPHHSKIESLDVGSTIPSGGSIKVETSSIQTIQYVSLRGVDEFNFSLASENNLSVLNISFVGIMDNVVEKLVAELSSIKMMSFSCCRMTQNIRIASQTLEELEIDLCYGLVNITLDAPQLKTFCYTGDLQLSSVTSSHSVCNARLNLIPCDIDTQSLIKLNRLLSRSKCFNAVSMDPCYQINIDMDELSKIDATQPYEVKELKLSPSRSLSEKSTLVALLDGLFWSCRPAVLFLSFFLTIDEPNTILKLLLKTLEEKVECRMHPLKRIETGSTDSSAINFQLRLFW